MRELYQQVILDHSRNPRHFQERQTAAVTQTCYNPMCGDRIVVHCDFKNDSGDIKRLTFSGGGCAISMASASMMMGILQNRDKAFFSGAFQYLRDLIACGDDAEVPIILQGSANAVAGMRAIAGVREYPMRVKCATCAWHSMSGVCRGGDAPIKTE